MTVRLTEIVHGLEIGPVGTCCQTGALGQAGAEVRHSIQRAEHLRRLRPVQAKIAINQDEGGAEDDKPGLVGLEATGYGVVDDPVRIRRCGGRKVHGGTLAPTCPAFPAQRGALRVDK